jgi:hypothetical protein
MFHVRGKLTYLTRLCIPFAWYRPLSHNSIYLPHSLHQFAHFTAINFACHHYTLLSIILESLHTSDFLCNRAFPLHVNTERSMQNTAQIPSTTAPETPLPSSAVPIILADSLRRLQDQHHALTTLLSIMHVGTKYSQCCDAHLHLTVCIQILESVFDKSGSGN